MLLKVHFSSILSTPEFTCSLSGQFCYMLTASYFNHLQHSASLRIFSDSRSPRSEQPERLTISCLHRETLCPWECKSVEKYTSPVSWLHNSQVCHKSSSMICWWDWTQLSILRYPLFSVPWLTFLTPSFLLPRITIQTLCISYLLLCNKWLPNSAWDNKEYLLSLIVSIALFNDRDGSEATNSVLQKLLLFKIITHLN